jgi:hypothetical protein
VLITTFGDTVNHRVSQTTTFNGKPIILTEGPIKALVCVQAGFDAIGINGVWGAGLKNSGGLYVQPNYRMPSIGGDAKFALALMPITPLTLMCAT